jgi:ribonuclease D
MRFIETADQLESASAALSAESLIAADTEAAGYHRYDDRVCVVQLSTRRDTFVIDALAVDPGRLHALFGDRTREIVLHDAEYDLRLLARDHGISVGHLFDTKVAAQLLGEPAIGLAGLAAKYLGVRMDKKHQRADWAQRPLPIELLEYAADDTRHLPELRDRLRAELDRLGRLAWAEEEFALRTATPFQPADNGRDAFLRLRNIRDLGPRQLAALREVHAWRDRVARERDVAPFRVVSNDALVGIARRMPDSPAELATADGVDAAATRNARDLVAAVQRARALPDSALPVRPRGPRRPPPDPAFDHLVDRLKAARDAVADELGLDRGFLMPRQQLEDIARAMPRSSEELMAVQDIRNWQVEALGRRLLAVIED